MELGRFYRYWIYLRRAHFNYFGFLLSMLNFITIQYYILVKNIPFLASLFPRLYIFVATVLAIYIPLTIFLGRRDFKKMTVPVETGLMARYNPYNRDIARALRLIAEGRNEEAIEILKKWESLKQ